MPDVYRRVMTGTAVSAAILTTGYLVATAATISDGIGVGLEMPPAINSLIVAASCCSATISSCAWLIRASHKRAAEAHLRPIIRDELDKAFAETMPLLIAAIADAADRRAAGVADAVAGVVDDRIQTTAVAAAKQTAARFREQHIDDLTEICDGLHRKTLIAGMQIQANATGEQLGKTALRSVKTYVSTPQGD